MKKNIQLIQTYTLPGMVQQLWWCEGERVLEDPQEL